MIFSLFWDFFELLDQKSFPVEKWKTYRSLYYHPHREFLRTYFTHFPLLNTQSLRQRVEAIKISDYSTLRHLVSTCPPEKLIKEAYIKCINIKPPEEEPDVYLFIGFFSPDGFVMNYKKKPVICFGLERFKDFELLKILFAHEYAHFLLSQGKEEIPEEKRFQWLIISEGVAAYLSQRAFPNRKLSDHLLFTNDKLNWCQENESYIREKYFSGKLTPQELINLYTLGDSNLGILPRAGRYLGFQALKRYVHLRTEGGIQELLSDRNKALDMILPFLSLKRLF
jgi:hypothetical protein